MEVKTLRVTDVRQRKLNVSLDVKNRTCYADLGKSDTYDYESGMPALKRTR